MNAATSALVILCMTLPLQTAGLRFAVAEYVTAATVPNALDAGMSHTCKINTTFKMFSQQLTSADTIPISGSTLAPLMLAGWGSQGLTAQTYMYDVVLSCDGRPVRASPHPLYVAAAEGPAMAMYRCKVVSGTVSYVDGNLTSPLTVQFYMTGYLNNLTDLGLPTTYLWYCSEGAPSVTAPCANQPPIYRWSVASTAISCVSTSAQFPTLRYSDADPEDPPPCNSTPLARHCPFRILPSTGEGDIMVGGQVVGRYTRYLAAPKRYRVFDVMPSIAQISTPVGIVTVDRSFRAHELSQVTVEILSGVATTVPTLFAAPYPITPLEWQSNGTLFYLVCLGPCMIYLPNETIPRVSFESGMIWLKTLPEYPYVLCDYGGCQIGAGFPQPVSDVPYDYTFIWYVIGTVVVHMILVSLLLRPRVIQSLSPLYQTGAWVIPVLGPILAFTYSLVPRHKVKTDAPQAVISEPIDLKGMRVRAAALAMLPKAVSAQVVPVVVDSSSTFWDDCGPWIIILALLITWCRVLKHLGHETGFARVGLITTVVALCAFYSIAVGAISASSAVIAAGARYGTSSVYVISLFATTSSAWLVWMCGATAVRALFTWLDFIIWCVAHLRQKRASTLTSLAIVALLATCVRGQDLHYTTEELEINGIPVYRVNVSVPLNGGSFAIPEVGGMPAFSASADPAWLEFEDANPTLFLEPAGLHAYFVEAYCNCAPHLFPPGDSWEQHMTAPIESFDSRWVTVGGYSSARTCGPPESCVRAGVMGSFMPGVRIQGARHSIRRDFTVSFRGSTRRFTYRSNDPKGFADWPTVVDHTDPFIPISLRTIYATQQTLSLGTYDVMTCEDSARMLAAYNLAKGRWAPISLGKSGDGIGCVANLPKLALRTAVRCTCPNAGLTNPAFAKYTPPIHDGDVAAAVSHGSLESAEWAGQHAMSLQGSFENTVGRALASLPSFCLTDVHRLNSNCSTAFQTALMGANASMTAYVAYQTNSPAPTILSFIVPSLTSPFLSTCVVTDFSINATADTFLLAWHYVSGDGYITFMREGGDRKHLANCLSQRAILTVADPNAIYRFSLAGGDLGVSSISLILSRMVAKRSMKTQICTDVSCLTDIIDPTTVVTTPAAATEDFSRLWTQITKAFALTQYTMVESIRRAIARVPVLNLFEISFAKTPYVLHVGDGLWTYMQMATSWVCLVCQRVRTLRFLVETQTISRVVIGLTSQFMTLSFLGWLIVLWK